MRYNEVSFEVTYDDHQNLPKFFIKYVWSNPHDLKIELIIFEPHHVKFFIFLQTSSIVYLFDFLIFDIFLTCDILLKHISLAHGYFFFKSKIDFWKFSVPLYFSCCPFIELEVIRHIGS